jgi:hypothetical protein
MLSPFGELKDCVVIVEKMTQKSKVRHTWSKISHEGPTLRQLQVPVGPLCICAVGRPNLLNIHIICNIYRAHLSGLHGRTCSTSPNELLSMKP